MLNFEGFQEYVKNNIKNYLPAKFANANVDIAIVKKNNGLELHGLAVRGEGQALSPTIYLEEFYKQYRNDTDIKTIMENISDVYMHNLEPRMELENIGKNFQDFDWVRDKIIMVAVGAESNKKLLSEVPYQQKEDIALVFKVLLSTEKDGIGTVTIRNEHLKFWDVDPETVYELAKENTRRLQPVKVQSMNEVMKELMIADGMPEEMVMDMLESVPADQQMYVISNESKINGAASIFYEETLYELAEKLDSDLYILPSSIHEVIAVKTSMGAPAELSMMVTEINEGQVSKEERLTNNVYLYDRESRDWSLANKNIEVSNSISEEDKKYITGLATDIYMATEPDDITLDEFVNKAIDTANKQGAYEAIAELKDQERSLKERCITLDK